MIEQQLKIKQAAGQPVAMPAGNFKTNEFRYKYNISTSNMFSGNGNPQAQLAVSASPQQQQVQQVGGTGQADYSKQWAEYYRSIGKNDEAEAIEKQIQTMKVHNTVISLNYLLVN